LDDRFPFFRATHRNGETVTEGSPSWRGGTRVGAADGLFAEWDWDGAALTIRNDRYGFYPVCFNNDNGSIAVATNPLRLIAEGVPAAPDHAAIAAFLRLGFFLEDDTPWRGIRMLPPCATLRWRDGAVTLDCRPPYSKPQEIGRDAALDGYIALFREAVARRGGEDCAAMPLSGGKDSRHILLELARQGRAPHGTVTALQGVAHDRSDAAVAARLSARLGIPHMTIGLDTALTGGELRKNVLTGFCGDEGGWMTALGRYLRGHTRVVHDGIGGDVLSAGLFVNAERIALAERDDRAGLVRSFYAECGVWSEAALGDAVALLGDAQALSAEAAEARIMAALAPQMARHNPATSFYFWNRTRREIAGCSLGMLAGIPAIHAPYLDHALFDFLTALPERMLADKRFHLDAIARAFPEFDDIGYAGPAPHGESAISRLASRGRAAAALIGHVAARGPGFLGRTMGWAARSAAGGARSLNRNLFTLALQSRLCADPAEAARALDAAGRAIAAEIGG
jgi:asparagine synthase (glutamine-hydrolysing)